MKIGAGTKIRHLALHLLAPKLGDGLCNVVLAIHFLTGGDFTSKFGTKHAALLANPEFYLSEFGRSQVPKEEVLQLAETFLTKVLKKDTSCNTMDELRYHLYFHASKKKTLENLPPSSRATREHILRSYFLTFNTFKFIA